MTTSRGLLRVPEITAYFWIIKGLSTAMGESTSDYLVHVMPPVLAVLLGSVGFVVAMVIQFSMRRYVAWAYWLAVVMVGVFGTMVADVLHVGFGVPYLAAAIFFAVVLAANFSCGIWRRGPCRFIASNNPTGSLLLARRSSRRSRSERRHGDLTAITLHLGYLWSAGLFAVIIMIPASLRTLPVTAVFAFWFAYVDTRPLGASIADWLGKTVPEGGLGVGNGLVALVLTAVIAGFVAYLAVSRRDVQPEPSSPLESDAATQLSRGGGGMARSPQASTHRQGMLMPQAADSPRKYAANNFSVP